MVFSVRRLSGLDVINRVICLYRPPWVSIMMFKTKVLIALANATADSLESPLSPTAAAMRPGAPLRN